MPSDANVMPRAATTSFRATDPRVLLVSTLLVVLASMTTVRTLSGMLGLFLFVAVWFAITAGLPAAARAIRRIAPFAIVILVINVALVPGEALVSIAGHRVVSAPGLHDGILFGLRLGVMLMAVSVLVAGASAEALAQGVHDILRRVSRPVADRVAFFTFVSAGFVPLFIDEIARVRTAQAFRAGTAGRGLLKRAAAVRTWLIPVVMSAVRRSGQVALAVELRDVRSRLVPSLPPLRMRAADAAWLALSVMAVVLASQARQG